MFGKNNLLLSSNNNNNDNNSNPDNNNLSSIGHRINQDSSIQRIHEENYEQVLMKIKKADLLAEDKLRAQKTIEKIVEEKTKDCSPEAKRRRLKRTIRAAIGEFFATLFFLFPQMATNINGHIKEWDPDMISLSTSLVAGFSAIACCFAFSALSGSNFNPAISLALGVTQKMSKRRVLMYIFAQLIASLVSVSLAASMFDLTGNQQYTSYSQLFVLVTHADDDKSNNYINSKIFATEFITTFLFTYIVFLVAFEDAAKNKIETMSLKQITDSAGLVVYTTTPNSSTAFAPFIIGFTLFSLSMTGGATGAIFNPAALFGPAVICNEWNHIPLCLTGEFLGSCSAAFIVGFVHNYGVDNDAETNDISAATMNELELTEVETHNIRESLRK